MVARDRTELLEFFDEQIGFLERSNAAFDEGHASEAKRLAVTLRVLFHHTADDNPRGSHALINQLNLRDTLTWVDSAGQPDPPGKNLVVAEWGLIQMGISIDESKAVFRAPLGDRPPIMIRTTIQLPRFSRVYTDLWWTQPVTRDAEHAMYSRKDFVLALANQEGGAHVDPQIKAAYHKIANSNSMGWTYEHGDDEPVPLSNPVPHMVRQISYEVVESVRQQKERIK